MISFNFRNIFLLFLFILPWGVSYAQTKNISTQQLAWFRYFNRLNLSDKWQINSQIEERAYISPWKQHQFTVRSQAVFKINSFISISQGFVFLLQTIPQDPSSPVKLHFQEYRPFQDIIISNDINKKIKLSHRYRLEERFYQKNQAEKVLEGYSFNFRVRYLLRLDVSLFNIRNDAPLKLTISDELMANFGKVIIHNTFDQNRFTIGLGYDFSKSFGVEIDYLNWFQQRRSGRDFYLRHIARVTVYHTINLRRDS